MKRKARFAAVVLAALMALSGCSVETVQSLYRVPQRPARQENLLRAKQTAMEGREYAPLLSEPSQGALQMRDLNADGQMEYLIFSRKEQQLQMLVLCAQGEDYRLTQTVDFPGISFGAVDAPREESLRVWLMDGQGALAWVQQLSIQPDGSLEKISSGHAAAMTLEGQLSRIDWEDTHGEPRFTFVQYPFSWELELQGDFVAEFTVTKNQSSYEFYRMLDGVNTKIFTIFCFTGADREAQAAMNNRFILGRTRDAVYSAYMEVASGTVALTQEHLKTGFSLWDYEET